MAKEPSDVPYRGTIAETPDSSLSKKDKSSSKVAIPRLQQSSTTHPSRTASAQIHRVSHACEPCRTKKTKCSGERPVCKHCQNVNSECYYADGKRDKFKREYDTMKVMISRYEKILRDNGLASNIKKHSLSQASTDPSGKVIEFNEMDFLYSNDDSDVDSEASLHSLDKVDEDILDDHGIDDTGYMGKTSEVSWMRRLAYKQDDSSSPDKDQEAWTSPKDNTFSQADSTLEHPPSRQAYPDPKSTQNMSYHHNQADIQHHPLPANEEWQLPHTSIIRQGLETHFDLTHPMFPIVSKVDFMRVLDTGSPPNSREWYAQLNLILAIASHYKRLTGQVLDEHTTTSVFFARAQKILATEQVLLQSPDLRQIQAIGLASFYLMSINQINRAWLLIGRGLRYAVSVGFHLRTERTDLQEAEKEVRYRTWWSLYTLDRLLGIMTGRPSTMSLGEFSVPLPRPILEQHLEHYRLDLPRTDLAQVLHNPHMADETPSTENKRREVNLATTPLESTIEGMAGLRSIPPNHALFFRCQVHLDLITHSIVSGLYRIINHSQIIVLGHDSPILKIESRLEEWLFALPPRLDFTRPQLDVACLRASTRLGFSYYSAKIILYRPCLCDPSSKAFVKPKAKQLANIVAIRCITSAIDMLSLIHDTPHALDLYTNMPWFALVHYIMQAAIVLLTELNLKAYHLPLEQEALLAHAKRAVVLLHSLAATSHVACSAFERAYDILSKVASRINGNLDDVPNAPPLKFPTYTPPEASHMQLPHMARTSAPQNENWYNPQPQPTLPSQQLFEDPFGSIPGTMGTSMVHSAPMLPDFTDPRAWVPPMDNSMMGLGDLGYTQHDLGMDFESFGGKYENGSLGTKA